MGKLTELNEIQRRLARHALGLPSSSKRSYRNRFFTSTSGEQYNAWLGLEQRGLAESMPSGSQVHFWLTKLGATAALEPGESLDPEDFPARPNGEKGRG